MKQTALKNMAIAIVAIGLSGMAFAADTANNKASPGNSQRSLSSADKAFIKEAAKGGMMEVAMGRVAEQNASNADVKKFGARMVADHGKANSELKSIAAEEKVELPADPGAGKWKSDKDYMSTMVKDHEKDLAEFEKEAKDGSDADVKRFADKTSKVIRKHLDMAKEIDGKLK
jgi:putative membrane protein